MNLSERSAAVIRKTKETDIELSIDLNGSGNYSIDTGSGFFTHMLEQLSMHSGFDINIKAVGDLHVDCHHLVEDVGIALGQAFAKCISDKKAINRYGSMQLPMDEALCSATVDICGRANLVFNCDFGVEKIGEFDVETVEEFFKAFVGNSAITLHINVLYGKNAHHMVEGVFKAVARALKQAAALSADGKLQSTKGCL